jgi:ribosomal protein S18 acetylase RimI-like enzyme
MKPLKIRETKRPRPLQHDFSIRRPRLEDLDQLLIIENRCFRAHRFTRKDFEYHLKNPASIFAVAERANKIVGYIAGIIHRGPGFPLAKIYSMAVLHGSRNSGVGSSLLKYFEREAGKRKSHFATLEVRKSNQSARALYLHSGYEVVNELQDYYAPGSAGLRMRKNLSPIKNPR